MPESRELHQMRVGGSLDDKKKTSHQRTVHVGLELELSSFSQRAGHFLLLEAVLFVVRGKGHPVKGWRPRQKHGDTEHAIGWKVNN